MQRIINPSTPPSDGHEPQLTGLEIMERIAALRRHGPPVYLDDDGRLVTEDGDISHITHLIPHVDTVQPNVLI